MSHPPHAKPALDGRQAARVGVSEACREISEYIASRVPTTGDDPTGDDGAWIAFALRVRSMSLELLFRAYTMERMRGTPPAAIADQLHLSLEDLDRQFGHADLSHHADAPGQIVWDTLAKTCINPVPGSCASTADDAARELDEWYRRWRQPDDHPAGGPTHAVSANL